METRQLFLATDCHFLYLQLLSLPRSQYIHNPCHKRSPYWTERLRICSLPTQSCSFLLATAASLSPDAQFPEQHAEEECPCIIGDGHNSVLLQQMSYISLSLKPRNEIAWGGGGKEQKNDGRCSLTDSVLQIRPSDPDADASCPNAANLYKFHISHAHSGYLWVNKDKSHLRRIYSFLHRGFNYILAFRIKGSQKLVWEGRSHQSEQREGAWMAALAGSGIAIIHTAVNGTDKGSPPPHLLLICFLGNYTPIRKNIQPFSFLFAIGDNL